MILKKYNCSILTTIFFTITLLMTTSNIIIAEPQKTEYEDLYKQAAGNLDKLNEFLENAEYGSCVAQCPGYFSGEKSIKISYCLAKCKIAYQTKRLKRIINR